MSIKNEKHFETNYLGEVAENHDNKKVPLKSSDRDKREGAFPYFGATGIIDTIDDYLFDGEYLLVAEDGKI